MSVTVTFCGHSQIEEADLVRQWLQDSITKLIERGARTFYLGNHGGFDRLVYTVLKECKQRHPEIEIVLVLAYLDSIVETTKYDSICYPPLESVPRRFAILKRNEWMVVQSDIVVAYVKYGWGGAAKTLDYAKRRKKEIVLFQ